MTWFTLVEVQEEMVQTVTHELDQIYIGDGAEGNEEVEYVDLVEVPVLENAIENVLENPKQKKQIQSKITLFLKKSFFKAVSDISVFKIHFLVQMCEDLESRNGQTMAAVAFLGILTN